MPSRFHAIYIRCRTLLRSSAVGILATASDLATLSILVYAFRIDPQIANVPSLLPGLVVMFIGNKYFAFEDKSKEIVQQGTLFLLIEAIAFLLNILFFHLLIQWTAIPPVWARMLGTLVTYLGFSFPLWSLFVFKKPPPPVKSATESEASEDGIPPTV